MEIENRSRPFPSQALDKPRGLVEKSLFFLFSHGEPGAKDPYRHLRLVPPPPPLLAHSRASVRRQRGRSPGAGFNNWGQVSQLNSCLRWWGGNIPAHARFWPVGRTRSKLAQLFCRWDGRELCTNCGRLGLDQRALVWVGWGQHHALPPKPITPLLNQFV